MRYVKHLSAALMALGLSVPVLAKHIYTDPIYVEPIAPVLVPSQHGGFKVGIDTLYLRNNAITNISDTSYDIGFYGEVGYLFPATPNDLTLAYTYLRADNNDSMKIDSVDLEGGHRLSVGPLDLRLFTGVRYTHLDSSFNNSDYSNSSKFHGWGPQFGIDARYKICDACFGLDTHLNSALLVGTLNTKYQEEGYIISESTNKVVPHVGAKLGVDYTYIMSETNKSAVVFEIGYQADHHFKVVDNYSDASFDGPYFDVKYYA